MSHKKPDERLSAETLAVIQSAILAVLRDTGYGSVEITIHDNRVTQIEKREKVRFDHISAKK